MEDSLEGSTPRRLLRRFMQEMDVQDTPTPIRTRRASAQNTQSTSKRRSRASRQSRGKQSNEVLHQQSKQSSSFIDQSLNMSVIQGVNQTYANIVAPDSDSSSLTTSPDIKKTSKWHTKRKRKLDDASLPADVVPKPSSKKRSEKLVLPPSDTSAASLSKEAVSGEKGSDTTYAMAEEAQPQTQEASTSRDKSHIIPQKLASLKGGAEEAVRVNTISPNVSSISASSAEPDGTYDFTSEKDDTFSSIVETRKRFGNQITSRKLNLPSVIEVLQTKQKSTDAGTVADVGTSDLKASTITTKESLQTPHEALEEPSKSNKSSQNISNDFIPPPLSFRDSEISSLHEGNFSNDQGENIIQMLSHQEESVANQDILPTTPLPVQEEGAVVGPQSASAAKRKSVGQVSVTSTVTPIRSSPRKHVGKISVATSTTPIRSSPRKSIGQVSVATSITPTGSAQRKKVGEVIDTTTSTRSAQRKSVGGNRASILVSPQTDEVVKDTATTGSAVKKNTSQASKTGLLGSTANISVPSAEDRNATSLTPQREGETDDARETDESPQGISDDKKRDEFMIPSDNEDRSPNKKRIDSDLPEDIVENALQEDVIDVAENALSKDAAEDVLPEDVIDVAENALSKDAAEDALQEDVIDVAENALPEHAVENVAGDTLTKDTIEDVAEDNVPEGAIEEASHDDNENETSLNPVSVRPSHASHRNMSSSTVYAHKGETSLPKIKATPTPKKQSSAPISTTRVRQMTMKEFLEQLKTKPVPPPVSKPKPLLTDFFGTSGPSKTPAKAPERLKHKRGTKKRELSSTLPRSATKEIFTHFAKCRVTSRAVDEVVKTSEIFWQNLTRDLSAIMSARKSSQQIEAQDVEKLMKRQGVITPEKSLNALVEELLPVEMWNLFMPFPNPAKNPFPPFTGPLFNPDKAADFEDESAG